MDLTILGSAAAEGWPALYCSCDACMKALANGGKDFRRRTSYRLGDSVQIDWGPDTFGACLAFGMNTSTITDLVVTHSHEDHFTPKELWYRRNGFSHVEKDRTLTVHGSEQVEEAMRTQLPDDAEFNVRFSLLKPFAETELPGGLSVTPIPAAHAADIGGALNFIFHLKGKHLLIGNDTGWWDTEVWGFLAETPLSVAVMDCTYGDREERRGHLGAPDVAEARQELLSLGALTEDCRFIANHFSHNGKLLHAELEAYFAPHGIEVGYDGMRVEW